jgi:endogenous inhibitor of DNA gyrase (YacG/DUF329 family)
MTGDDAKRASDEASKRPAGGRCPICGKPTVHAVRPFCSSRCADIDLGRWVSGAYAIGSQGDGDEDGDDALAAGLPARGRGEDEDAQ